MRATVSLRGMMIHAPDLLDELVIPANVSRETLIGNLIAETVDMTLMYTNPKFLKPVIGHWSQMRLPVWEKLYETTQYEYDPIENYDRKEERTLTEHHSGHGTETREGQYNKTSESKTLHSGSGSIDTSTNDSTERSQDTDITESTKNDSTTETRKSAYNENTYQPVDEVTVTGNDSRTSNGSVRENNSSTGSSNSSSTDAYNDTNNGTEDGNNSESSQNTDQYDNEHHENIRAHGNIGVTTTQQMIQQEREIVQFNLMRQIIDEFIERFCLLVY